jgi:protein tyrosine phosphatase (PTP) superfamily phosphohydrolase (DUF442 family)
MMNMRRTILTWSLMTLPLLVVSARPAAAETVEDIPNFHEVTPFLFRSAHLQPSHFAMLRDYGIRDVLTLEDYLGNQQAAADEEKMALDVGMEFSWLPMDGLAKPSIGQLDQALAYIADPAHQPVLVHCLHGSDRTGMVIAAYRIKYQLWPVDQARHEMYQYGHSIFLSWWDHLLWEVH